jgi:hypothetical protein
MSTTTNGAAKGPTGQKIARYISHTALRPGIGVEVRKTQEPAHLGGVSGVVFGATETEMVLKGVPKKSIRFDGDFTAWDSEGKIFGVGAQAYLPPVITKALAAALRMNPSVPIPLAIEVWCVPDNSAGSLVGYTYDTYDRRRRSPDDMATQIAIAAGFMPDPRALIGPEITPDTGGDMVEIPDPETGEAILVPRASLPATAGAASAAQSGGGTGAGRQRAGKVA